MIAAEFAVIVVILVLGAYALVRWIRRCEREEKAYTARLGRRNTDFEAALKARDHRMLDDWLIMYDDIISKDLRRNVQVRRDELFIESESREEGKRS